MQWAVAVELQPSRPLITPATVIAVGVFGAVTARHLLLLMAIGLGPALAVAMDATILRIVIVLVLERLLT